MTEMLDLASVWDAFYRDHQVGDVVSGTVIELTGADGLPRDGARVDLGGVEGFIPASAVSWAFHRACLPPLGAKVYCPILRLEGDARKVVLAEPIWNWEQWKDIEERYPVGSRHQGQVVHLASFGAFVRFEPGVEGLLPTDGLRNSGPSDSPKALLSEGQLLEVVIGSVTRQRQELLLEFP